MIEFTTVPALPGVYLFKDKKGRILYVGKAKILRNRLRSYFHGDLDPRKSKMVELVKDFHIL